MNRRNFFGTLAGTAAALACAPFCQAIPEVTPQSPTEYYPADPFSDWIAPGVKRIWTGTIDSLMENFSNIFDPGPYDMNWSEEQFKAHWATIPLGPYFSYHHPHTYKSGRTEIDIFNPECLPGRVWMRRELERLLASGTQRYNMDGSYITSSDAETILTYVGK